MFIAYTLVALSYLSLGSLGYFGFMGSHFAPYFEERKDVPEEMGKIDQNCLNMFEYRDIPAFVLRIAVFCLIFSAYPVVSFFLTD